MKKIEKEIKKNSTELIESSLPEIESLDKIPTKTKKTGRLPLFLIPCGAALAISAIMIPVLLKQFAPIAPVTSNSTSGSAKSHTSNSTRSSSNNGGGSSHNHNNNYKPAFKSYDEVAYYSYFGFHGTNAINNNQLKPLRGLMKQNDGTSEEEQTLPPTRENYVDEYGRYHYPIPYDMEYVFSDFLYFEFDTVDNAFLEQRIGNGHIYGLTVKTNIMDNETILILKNGDYFYSCLTNGGGSLYTNGPAYIEFSSHKTIEEFDVVKDATNKRYLTLNFDRCINSTLDYESLLNINIEGEVYAVNPESFFFDPTPIQCGMNELKERLGNNPDYEIFDIYGGLDTLVYDAIENPEVTSFALEEFEGTFNVSDNKLYLDETEILSLNNVNKIYASEINKDAHRDLIFESNEDSARAINVYDVRHNKYLYRKFISEVDMYDYYLDMRDDRLVINLFKQGFVSDEYILDYGRFSYTGNDGMTIVWQNLYELIQLKLDGVYQADGETPVVSVNGSYNFVSNTPYIIEMELSKFNGHTNPDYPASVHQIRYALSMNSESTSVESISWNFISMENGVYRYQISFQESGNFECVFLFYDLYFELSAIVSE